MCGIAGILNLDGQPADAVLLGAMTDAIAHRGPDGEGYFVEGNVGLGHRRLAVIDLTPAGHQPMQTRDGRFVLSYNGEVYNFHELRLTLEARGHQFVSRTDSEVVLHALAEWGVDALPHFNGMFAFALWDREHRELLLARDRYGIKPLYWARHGETVLFGSEAKAILAHPRFARAVDSAALLQYMTFQNLFTEQTLFRDISLLPSGTWLRFGANGSRAQTRWWDYDFSERAPAVSDAALSEELDRLFHQAVSRQLISDVPVGAYLSGGIDSGSVVAQAANQIDNLRTFTVGFDLHSASGLELGVDERSAAELMSYSFGTEHYEMVLKAGDMERCMRNLVTHVEEPRVGQCYPNYYAARLAARFGKVVLSGTGGDELFAGYPWRYYRAVVNDDFEHYIDKYYGFWQRLVPADALQRMLAPLHGEVGHIDTRDIFRDIFYQHAETLTRPEDYINHSLYFEARTFLHGLLVVEDKLSMARGLETRVPFLDNDLVDFAMALPVRHKLGKLAEVVRLDENEPGPRTSAYFERSTDGKLILREAMRRHVPASVVDGEKRGFSAPDASWFRGESIDYVRDALFAPNARIYDMLDRSAVQVAVQEHLDGKVNRRLFIWSLLYLETFLETFMGAGALTSGKSSAIERRKRTVPAVTGA